MMCVQVVKSAEPVEYVQKEGSAANTIRLTAEYAKTQPIAAEDIHPTSSSNVCITHTVL